MTRKSNYPPAPVCTPWETEAYKLFSYDLQCHGNAQKVGKALEEIFAVLKEGKDPVITVIGHDLAREPTVVRNLYTSFGQPTVPQTYTNRGQPYGTKTFSTPGTTY